jgi:hypothetical protein
MGASWWGKWVDEREVFFLPERGIVALVSIKSGKLFPLVR